MSEVAATPKPIQVAPSKPAAGAQSTLADELDDEIVEIFLEEADEEHGNISRLLPHWQNNPQDMNSLKDLRRSFHTLKGSGRLVGAVDVGEFAWAFETLLNRVLDNSIKPDNAMFELLERARNSLPGLFEMFRNGQKPGQDVYKLMEQAESLSKGETIDLAADAVSVQASSVEEEPEFAEELTIDGLQPSTNAEAEEMSMELEGMDSLADVHAAGIQLDEPSVELSIEGIDIPDQQPQLMRKFLHNSRCRSPRLHRLSILFY